MSTLPFPSASNVFRSQSSCACVSPRPSRRMPFSSSVMSMSPEPVAGRGLGQGSRATKRTRRMFGPSRSMAQKISSAERIMRPYSCLSKDIQLPSAALTAFSCRWFRSAAVSFTTCGGRQSGRGPKDKAKVAFCVRFSPPALRRRRMPLLAAPSSRPAVCAAQPAFGRATRAASPWLC